jgi:xanthine dehydrogenase molybdopterin-binding subunit B
MGEQNVSENLTKSEHVLKGEVHLGGQEHFYLESQSCLVVPSKEDNEIEVFCSAQAPSAIQVSINILHSIKYLLFKSFDP